MYHLVHHHHQGTMTMRLAVVVPEKRRGMKAGYSRSKRLAVAAEERVSVAAVG